MKNYFELSLNDAMAIYGGKPNDDTSLVYDIVWGIVKGAKWVVDLF